MAVDAPATAIARNEHSRPSPTKAESVLVLTPLGKDAEHTKFILDKAGIRAEICRDLDDLCELSNEETGVLLIAEEALTNDLTPKLLVQLNKQPAWSDIPIVIFTARGERTETNVRVMRLFEKSGNVTMLERPIHALTLFSAIQVALRARRRQWEIRDLIRQREQLLEEARAARGEAESANRMKDQFLATLSHELRTPLNAILGWCQILQGGPNSEEDIRLGLETIDRNARTQAQLIEDLLDISRIISGKLRLDIQHVELLDSIQAAVAAVQPAAEAKNIKVVTEIDPKLDSIMADPARLQQICWNLLSNAVKFTATAGRVLLRAVRHDGMITILIQDDGIGIDPGFLPYVFDRFRQADGSTTRRQGGLGLGLSIVKQLVELHGGSVSVESEGRGHGTSFFVKLPLRTPLSKNAAPHKPKPLHLDQRPIQRVSLQGLDVVVVDDEADARELLRRILSEHGASVRVVDSMLNCLIEIERQKPDVLLSDISMPDRDGFDLIHHLRTSGYSPNKLPAIALTAYARSEDQQRILRAGFQAHLSKPIDTASLTQLLAAIGRKSD
jgi:signal transduction histidine kinase/ActR/RegA family two-component response regulator